jgi:tetratricopeptide (TPR) repeat protein
VSEDYIRGNPEIKAVVGQVKDVTPTYPFSFDIGGREAKANIAFDVEGSKGSVKVFLVLAKGQGAWRVAAAQYQDSGGVIRPLSTDKSVPEGRGAGAGAASPAAGYKETLARGHAFFKANDFTNAAAEYSRAIQDDPSVYQGYYWRGIANARMNKDGDAAADFRKVVAIVPQHAGAFNWLGWLHYKNGRYDDAIADFSQSIRLRGDYGWSYYQRGRCYMQKGIRSQARGDFEKACLYKYKPACPEAERLKTDV